MQIIPVAHGALKKLNYSDKSKERADRQLVDFDRMLAIQFANLSPEAVTHLADVPDVLQRMGLDLSHFALLYMLGYEGLLRDEGLIPKDESPEDVAASFEKLASQPAGDATWRPPIFNGEQEQVFVTSVLGVQIHVRHQPTDTAITVSEAIVGTVEAFFATAFEVNAFAHTERFEVLVIEDDVEKYGVEMRLDQMCVEVRWPRGVFPGSPNAYAGFREMLLEVAGIAFGATCHTRDFKDAAERLLKNDGVMDRVSMIASLCFSRSRIFHGVARLGDWNEISPRPYPATADRPRVQRREATPSKRPSADTRVVVDFPKMTDHREVRVRSVIDVHLWDRAGWAETGYGVIDPKLPPFMALMFRDKEVATKIFVRWRERFGSEDKGEEIHIGIVRSFSREHPNHYGMVITSKYPEKEDGSRLSMMASRTLTMEPSDDVNLNGFLKLYEKWGAYLLMPLVLTPGTLPAPIPGLSLLKRSLTVKTATEVRPGDLENLLLLPRGRGPAKD